MAISDTERQIFERVIAEVGSDPEKAGVTLKVLFNVIKKTTNVPIELQNEVRKNLEHYPYQGKHEALQEDLKKLGAILMDVAQEEMGKTYSTGQLAKYFGVSITTINNWIAAGRFVGVERSRRNAQARISENTIWISPAGERVLVREIVENWHHQQGFRYHLPTDHNENLDRVRHVAETVKFYEVRYGKPFAEVVMEKGNPDEAQDWIWAREGQEWRSLLREIGDQ